MKKKFFGIMTALLFGMACALSGCAYIQGNGRVHGERYANADRYEIGDFSYRADTIDKIEVDWVLGEIELIESEKETLSVTESGKDLEEAQKLRHIIEGRTLKIKFWKSGYTAQIEASRKHVAIELPAGISLSADFTSARLSASTLNVREMDVSCTSGDVQIGTLTTQEADFNATSGSLSIETIQVRGKISTNFTSGSADIGTLTAYEAEFDASSGSVEIETAKLEGNLEADSTSGSIEIRTLTAYEAEFDTSSGSVTIQSASVQRELSHSSTSGSTRIDTLSAPLAEFSKSSGGVELGLSACKQLKISGTSASVEITLLEDLGATISHSSTSGKLTIKKKHSTQNKQHVIGNGACRISVQLSSGNLVVE
ncbi:MAG: DUF4097 family beta strand repeat protein [Clostridia bacterium]|nr:DUF4097 family beta strand repeat protein [Clostridia bacterium]